MASSSIERLRQRRTMARFVTLFLFVLSMIVFLAARGNPVQDRSVARLAEDGTSPLLTYASMPLRGIENIIADINDLRNVHVKNQRLHEELLMLKDVEMRANALALKIAKFESLLNVDVSPDIAETKIAARAVSEQGGPFVQSALINAGRNKGVAKGYAVMAPEGLYGHIVRAGARSARVLKLTDLNSRIAVMSLRSNGRAILSGNNTDRPGLAYQTDAQDWVAGDAVVTSGDGGMLPRGLTVGTVVENPKGELIVELSAKASQVDWVLVYPHIPTQPPKDEVEPFEDDTETLPVEGEGP